MSILLTAILAFASTNLDDLFILTLFFGDKSRTSRDIVIGQLLGIGTLIALSLAGSMLGSIFDPRYIGLLGLFPLYLGVKGMLSLWCPAINDDSESNPDLSQKKSLFAVAGVTIANGGDNIGIYVPLFATLSWPDKISTVVVFMLMTLVWCAAARYLAKHPWLEKPISRYGHWITPLVLMLLGIFILKESNAITLLP
jgi:cadmium resistance protein CadD (predicted permease)